MLDYVYVYAPQIEVHAISVYRNFEQMLFGNVEALRPCKLLVIHKGARNREEHAKMDQQPKGLHNRLAAQDV